MKFRDLMAGWGGVALFLLGAVLLLQGCASFPPGPSAYVQHVERKAYEQIRWADECERAGMCTPAQAAYFREAARRHIENARDTDAYRRAAWRQKHPIRALLGLEANP